MMAQGSPGSKLGKGMISHGRGHRLEAGFLLRRSRDDDLVLFTEMQKHETAKGGGDKNEYNWLLTPPSTPLISLDDDGAQPFDTSRAMRRTQTNSTFRQFVNEKTQRTSSRLNSSLAPRSNSAPSKPSTPTLQSMRKGTSPVKSSSSPKSRARQSNAPGSSKDKFETSKSSTDSCEKFGRQSTPPSASKRPNSSHSRPKQHIKASAGDDDADPSRKAVGAWKQTGAVRDKVNRRRSKCDCKHEKTYEEIDLSAADETCIARAGLGQDNSYPRFPSPEFYFHLLDSPVADNLNDEKSKKCTEVFFQNDRIGILDSSSTEDSHLPDDVGHGDSISGAATQNTSSLILEQQSDHCLQDSRSTSESNCAEHPPCKANVTAEALRKRTHKNVTMEETADSIIFCSSITHDLAYKVASIVIEKEMPATEASRPGITHLAKSASDQKNVQDIYCKRIKYSRKLKKKRQEIDSKKAFKELGSNNSRNKELAFSDDIMKSPNLESKCNCIVM